MSEEIRLDDVGVAPGVLETIASLAAESVDGVVALTSNQGLAGLVQKGGPAKSVVVNAGDGGELRVTAHLRVRYGAPLRDIARAVQRAIADALTSQTGQSVTCVDVFIDDIVFTD